MSTLYVGVMSGTSMDGIDAALFDFGSTAPKLLAKHHSPFGDKTRAQLRHVAQPNAGTTISDFARLDTAIGQQIANAVNNLILQSGLSKRDIAAIGSHGQTVFHGPDRRTCSSVQLGNPSIIAELTGVTTVADFRRRDMAAGGEGAPLAPAFHKEVFGSATQARAILNIGGIANVTLLPTDAANVIGFDTGPGNCFVDFWAQRNMNTQYDDQGAWARRGRLIDSLLDTLQNDDYFTQKPPKSTGKEYFSNNWLLRKIGPHTRSQTAQDIQTTLTEFTAASISQAIAKFTPVAEKIYVCGGGAFNAYLLERIGALTKRAVATTSELGIDPHWVEAAAFAWLAMRTTERKAGNLPSVTGADRSVILGGVYFA